MSGERRGRGRPRANQNVEEEFYPDGNMWAQMMQQNQQMMQQQIQQNAQSQQQWAAAMQQGQGAHQQHPPPPTVGNPAFREFTVIIPHSSMVKVNHKKLRGGLSTWKRFSE